MNPEEAQEQEAQKYETMQCFTVSEPKSIKEEGEGEKTRLTNLHTTCFSSGKRVRNDTLLGLCKAVQLSTFVVDSKPVQVYDYLFVQICDSEHSSRLTRSVHKCIKYL